MCHLCALFAATGVSIREEMGSRKFCCSGSGLPDYVQYPFCYHILFIPQGGAVGLFNANLSLYVLGKVQLVRFAENIKNIVFYFLFYEVFPKTVFW